MVLRNQKLLFSLIFAKEIQVGGVNDIEFLGDPFNKNFVSDL